MKYTGSSLLWIELLAQFGSAIAHSYLTAPISRTNQAQTQTGCRGPACLGPCDAPRSKAGSITPLQTIARGTTVTLRWPRNNHAGGFIRVAWAPMDQSDSHATFDGKVQLYTCHEMTCQSSNPADPTGGDSDGQAPGKCTTNISIPTSLTDGQWTLQWAWFGGAFALGDYYSCVDYTIQGGPSTQGDLKANYVGGDVHNRGSDKCLFFNTDRLHLCVNEPCTTGDLPGQHNGVPFGFGASTTNASTPTTPSPLTVQPLTSTSADVSQLASSPHSSTANGILDQVSNVLAPLLGSTDDSTSSILQPKPAPTQAPAPAQAPISDDMVLPEVSMTTDQLRVEIAMLYNDSITAQFGALLKLSTLQPNDTLSSWSISLDIPAGGHVTNVIGAKLASNGTESANNSTITLESEGPLQGTAVVAIQGELQTANQGSDDD